MRRNDAAPSAGTYGRSLRREEWKYISSRAKSPLHTPRVASPGRASIQTSRPYRRARFYHVDRRTSTTTLLDASALTLDSP